jgi:hypothetical protein
MGFEDNFIAAPKFHPLCLSHFCISSLRLYWAAMTMEGFNDNFHAVPSFTLLFAAFAS